MGDKDDLVLSELRDLKKSVNTRFDRHERVFDERFAKMEIEISHVRRSLFEGHEGNDGIVTRLALQEQSSVSHRKRLDSVERRLAPEPAIIAQPPPPQQDPGSRGRAKPYAVGGGIATAIAGVIYTLIELFTKGN